MNLVVVFNQIRSELAHLGATFNDALEMAFKVVVYHVRVQLRWIGQHFGTFVTAVFGDIPVVVPKVVVKLISSAKKTNKLVL